MEKTWSSPVFLPSLQILHHEVSHARCGREVTATKCTKTFDAPPSQRSEDHFCKMFFFDSKGTLLDIIRVYVSLLKAAPQCLLKLTPDTPQLRQ